MHELYELKEKLCDELKKYGTKELSAGTLDVVDKLAHAVKNIDKIIEAYDDYSGDYMGRSYARRRDSMGRYSRVGYSRSDISDKLRQLMNEAPDDKTRQEIQSLVSRMEMM